MSLRRASIAMALVSGLLSSPLVMAQANSVPWVERLTVVTAIAEPSGDYESRKQLLAHEDGGWRIAYSTSLPDASGKPRQLTSERWLHDEDLATARLYRSHFESDVIEDYPGTTALGASRVIIEELRGAGRSRFAVVGDERQLAKALEGLPADPGGVSALVGALMSGPPPTFRGELVLRKRGTLKVLIGSQPVALPVLVASGTFTAKNGQAMDVELSLLDDPANPLALFWRLGQATLRVVRIELPAPPASRDADAAEATSELEKALAQDKRVVLPGLYFDFGSAVLRPESEPALAEIVAAVREGVGALRLEGHTDNIGAGPANHALSLARAQSVKAALVARDPRLAARLQVEGYGATQPRAPNDTLIGRATNRRVELVLVP